VFSYEYEKGHGLSVTSAKGFVASGVSAGIRPSGKSDIALVHSTEPCVGGGMLSRNKVQAACLTVNREHLAVSEPRAVVVNSGVANSATGEGGLADAQATAAYTAGLLGVAPEQVLVLSTGVIGVRLPMEKLIAGIAAAVPLLEANGGDAAAEAIMTTDTRLKTAAVTTHGFTVGGMAKGAGMIHPDLATMLAVVTTDYPLGAGEPIGFLRPAVDETFNAISIDGECSTNDSVLLLANGASGVERTGATDVAFGEALLEVCRDLSRQIVADGEGVTVLAQIDVSGAVDDDQARAIARRIATSPLVKTALFGHDANWGRVLMAAGSAPHNGGYAEVDASRVSLSYNGSVVLRDGTPQDVQPDVSGPSCTIDLDLGLGSGSASYLTSDLSYEYVRINAEYTT
jgi:glutamate N-acetyltransferase/amino-acid N-acetyltransferase